MLILAIDTSTEQGSCALWRDADCVEFMCPAGQSHSATLLPLIRQLMAEGGSAFSALDGVAFGCGPGAFTGLRVACGVAQGLAVAHDLPVFPVTSLAAMAAFTESEKVLSLLDARMGEVYSAFLQRREVGAGLAYEVMGDILLSKPEDIFLPIEAGFVACGNAIGAYPALAERLASTACVVQTGILPSARQVAALAVPSALAGAGLDAALAAPLYIRDKVAKTIAERLQEGGRA